MGTAAAIGLGLFTWVVVAILVALLVARVIKLRDRQRPNRAERMPGDRGPGEEETDPLRRQRAAGRRPGRR